MDEKMQASQLLQFEAYLRAEERSVNTIGKYLRDVKTFFAYLRNTQHVIEKSAVLLWKEMLLQQYAPSSVNSMLAAVNHFLQWCGIPECKVKPVKIQRALFAKPEKELTRNEYLSLVEAAERAENSRLALLLQTLCATGIRVSELRFITVATLHTGRAAVDNKGKCRTVFLPTQLCRVLRQYCKERQIAAGPVFCTKSGTPIDRSNIWKDMKALCASAGVSPDKVFPHNLRHLFARTYYQMEKDISRLADLLGHTSVDTTRIYTMESGLEHAKQLNRMHLVCCGT